MKLEDLVPHLELCKKIPKGEFKNSVLFWQEIISLDTKKVLETEVFFRKNYTDYEIDTEFGVEYLRYPAPTLQEILEELETYKIIGSKEFTIVESQDVVGKQPVIDSALELWLKVKGIEL